MEGISQMFGGICDVNERTRTKLEYICKHSTHDFLRDLLLTGHIHLDADVTPNSKASDGWSHEEELAPRLGVHSYRRRW